MNKTTAVYESRISNLLLALKPLGVDAFLAIRHADVNCDNVRYLSGFSGSSAHLVLTEGHSFLATDDRYEAQATNQCPAYTVVNHRRKPLEKLDLFFKAHSLKKVGFETRGMTLDLYNSLTRDLPEIEWVPTSGVVESLRAVKDPEEIKALETATDIAVNAFHHLMDYIRPGATEKELAMEMEWHMRQNGADDAAFDIILVSGEKTALQHGKPSCKIIASGDFVLMDFGALYRGYRSDMTRTIAIGPVSQKHRQVYQTVQKAEALGVEMIKAGAVTGDIYAAVQNLIAAEGFGEYSGTGIGHSVGLALWEDPGFGHARTDVLQAGNVITMEPGIYIPGWGGVRIEDMVLVEEEGRRILSDIPRDLVVI